MPLRLDYQRPSGRTRRWPEVALLIAACLASPPLAVGLLQLGIGVVFYGWEGTRQLIVNGATTTLISVAWLVLVGLVYRWQCAPKPPAATDAAPPADVLPPPATATGSANKGRPIGSVRG